MSASWRLRLASLTFGSLLLVACGGGGGGGFAVDATSLAIASTTISEPPQGGDVNTLYESADVVDWLVPLTGGCGGPYVVDVIQGALPNGVGVVDGVDPVTQQTLHHLRGHLLEDGVFNFRLQVTDKSCTPFATTHADFRWEVAKGSVTIVDAEPVLYAPGTYERGGIVLNPIYPALQSTVYGQFTTHTFLVAGGAGPYSIEVVDDPANPNDGPPPLGTSIPVASTSITGAPVEIKSSGAPFFLTLRATDSLGQVSAPLTIQWEVYAPPILIAITDLPDGKAGSPYSAPVAVADGVPPFNFEFVACDVDRDLDGNPAVGWQAPLPPVVSPACAMQRLSSADYPAANDFGPDYRATNVPPEGISLIDQAGTPGAGTIVGFPRRRGDFRVVVHVWSALIPNIRGQHNWGEFEFSVEPSEPPVAPVPAFDHDPAYTVTGAFSPVQPYARIAEAEVGANYNPDAASHPALGLQLLAAGGVRKDGKTDAPHASETVLIDGFGPAQEDGSTPGGGYDWTVDPDPAGDGDAYSTLPPGMTLDGWTGVWRVSNSAQLVLQSSQALAFTVVDQQLPVQVRNVATQRVNFAVGPDKLIYTESTTSGTTTTGSNWWDMNDNEQTVRVCFPYTGSAPLLRDLELGDLSKTHVVPATASLTGSTALATLLTKVDLMRVSVNPTGWWDDLESLNANGARPGQHADRNGYDNYVWGENDNGTTSDLSRQPSATCVDLPDYRPGVFNAVAHDPDNGVYTDGGKLYAFSNGSYFGVFIVRSDSSIYVPFAISRTASVNGTVYGGFGDGVVQAHAQTGRSQLRMPHMTVSPDGRFAAMKIRTSETDFSETAATTPIVVFSLTGEKPFGGDTWSLVQSGSTGSTSDGVYLYAASMALTNTHLYYLCGNLYGTFSTQTANREHYLYRFQIANTTSGAVVAGSTGTGSFLPKADPLETEWTNSPNNRMQARFHQWYNPGISGYAPGLDMEWMNLLENHQAPLPFRVSADGRSIAVLAMIDQSSGVNQQAWHVWVDHQGAGVRRLSSAPRHVTGGDTRGYSLSRGSSTNTYENWGRYHGPNPHLEISDDGTKVAVVVNRYAGTPSISSPTSSWPTAREDVIAYRTANFSTWTELPVTGDGGSTNVFSATGGAKWRFGTLVFTKDNKGLVFTGGFSCYYAAGSSSSYHYSQMFGGTFYGTDISTATSITGLTVTSLLSASEGGSAAGVTSYSTSSPYNPTLPAATYSTVAGVIKPYGGFLSKNREFFYLVNKGGLETASAEYRLVGVNVRSTNTGASVNGHTDFRAFAVGGWPTRRGFLTGTYNYYAYYGLYYTDYPAYRRWGMGLQIMVKSNGWVLWGSHYQSSGPNTGTASSLYGGPLYSTYSYDYGSRGGEIEGFNADTGGLVRRLSSFNADTAQRRIHFLEPTLEGDSVAYVFDTYSTNNASPSNERLHVIQGIGFDTAGSLTATPTRTQIEGNPVRIGDAFTFSSAHDKLYYGVGTTANENTQVLKEATFGAGGSVSIRTLSSTQRRYNVLHASR